MGEDILSAEVNQGPSNDLNPMPPATKLQNNTKHNTYINLVFKNYSIISKPPCIGSAI